MNNDAEALLTALAKDMPEEQRLIVCAFPGDPNVKEPNAWKPHPWKIGRDLDFPEAFNVYTTVSSFGRAVDNSFRRRAETFAAGRALMVDDVGTKVERRVVEVLAPSAIVETSPGNEQWWYLLDPPEMDAARFDGVIRAFIASALLGADPGMSGINRVGRLPGFTNGKPKYKGFVTRLIEMNEGRRYSTGELLEAFRLSIKGRREPRAKLLSADAIERNRAFTAMYRFLEARGLLKRSEPDPSGWTEMICPWIEDHTDRANNGAAVREPAPENEYYGAFRCFHGHCADKGWAELTDWIAERAAEELEGGE